MSRDSTESNIGMMLGDDPSENKDSPHNIWIRRGSNSLDLSLRATEKLHSEFKKGSYLRLFPTRIIVEVMDEVTDREVVSLSVFGPQGIKTNKCPSIIHLE